MKKQSFIFLDIDGVINPDINKEYQASLGKSISSYYIELPRKQLNLLRYIVLSTGASIILSSKWRFIDYSVSLEKIERSPARKNLDKQFANYGLYIDGETPILNNSYTTRRGVEIQAWLNRFYQLYQYIPAYVILDDNINVLLPEHKGHIVCCSTYRGLSKHEANIVINLLIKQQNQI